jgi:hypothetical protein
LHPFGWPQTGWPAIKRSGALNGVPGSFFNQMIGGWIFENR